MKWSINKKDIVLLGTLQEHGELTQYKLAKLSGVEWVTTLRHIIRLENLGMLKRRSGTSRNSLICSITLKGSKLYEVLKVEQKS